jgi:hypothetical protein
MPNKVAFNAVMVTPAATMRHSPAFDIVGETSFLMEGLLTARQSSLMPQNGQLTLSGTSAPPFPLLLNKVVFH